MKDRIKAFFFKALFFFIKVYVIGLLMWTIGGGVILPLTACAVTLFVLVMSKAHDDVVDSMKDLFSSQSKEE